MEQNKKYRFRAMAYKKQVYYIMAAFWAILFCSFVECFPNEKAYVSVNYKIVLISTFLSSLLLLIINQLFISSVYSFQLNNQKISIFKNKKKFIDIPLSEISKVEFGTSTAFFNFTFIHFFFKNKNKNKMFITGFLFTSKKGTRQLKDFYFNHFREYLFTNSFINEDTAKIKKHNNFAERFMPITKNN